MVENRNFRQASEEGLAEKKLTTISLDKIEEHNLSLISLRMEKANQRLGETFDEYIQRIVSSYSRGANSVTTLGTTKSVLTTPKVFSLEVMPILKLIGLEPKDVEMDFVIGQIQTRSIPAPNPTLVPLPTAAELRALANSDSDSDTHNLAIYEPIYTINIIDPKKRFLIELRNIDLPWTIISGLTDNMWS